jgi:hypothetical protein
LFISKSGIGELTEWPGVNVLLLLAPVSAMSGPSLLGLLWRLALRSNKAS